MPSPPNSWSIPLVQAAAAAPYDRDLVAQYWREALARAVRIDERAGEESQQKKIVIIAINLGVRKGPSLRSLAEQIISENIARQP